MTMTWAIEIIGQSTGHARPRLWGKTEYGLWLPLKPEDVPTHEVAGWYADKAVAWADLHRPEGVP